MGTDSFSEITSQSWFGRLGNAFKGILVGLILVLIALVLLFWNEGRAVERYKTLKEGGGAVISISADTVDPANDSKLVHLSGRVDTDEILHDLDFGISTNAIKLIRDVQMYQWRESSRSETKKKLGGGEETVTTYSYSKEWSAQMVDSSSFKQPEGHQNPANMPYRSQTLTATDVRLGAFRLPGSLINQIRSSRPLAIDDDFQLPQSLQGKLLQQPTGFYLGKNPDIPQVGDLKISYSVVMPAEISLVARQIQSTFEPYRASAGGTIELLEMGIHAADSMFQKAQQSNTILTWVLRGGGFLLMIVGLSMALAPLGVLADVVPVIGSIIGAGTTLIAALLGAVLSCVTIGTAWFVYRPVLGGIFFAAAAGMGALVFLQVKKTEPVLPPIPPSAPPPIPKK